MVKIKNIAKAITPPVITSAISTLTAPAKTNEIFSGNFPTWHEAKKLCSGYESEVILQKCSNALLKIKNGDAVYERDSVIFNQIQYNWPLVASLQKAALNHSSRLTVLDFGGSLGSSYFQNKEFLNGLQQLHWCIVEQLHFVKTGKRSFENEQLKFYDTIEECLQIHRPDVLLLSGVLQYLSDPYTVIQKFVALKIPYIIIDRTAFINNEAGILTIQNVPPEIYTASYPAWFFNEKEFIDAFTGEYTPIANFADSFTNPLEVNGNMCYWKGFLFKKTDG